MAQLFPYFCLMDEWKRATDFLGYPLVMVLLLYGIYHYKNIVGSCCIGRNPNIDVAIRNMESKTTNFFKFALTYKLTVVYSSSSGLNTFKYAGRFSVGSP